MLDPGPRAALAEVRSHCPPEELTSGRLPGELSASCAPALRALFEEVGEYNQYHWGSPCGPDGQVIALTLTHHSDCLGAGVTALACTGVLA